MLPKVQRALLLVFLAASPLLATGSETVFTNWNCALTFPSGWHRAPAPADATNYFALAKSPDEKRSVLLNVRKIDSPNGVRIDQKFKREGIRAFKQEGSLSSEKDVVVSGQPAWEIAGELLFQGQKVTTVSHILFADDKAYKINAMSVGGDAASDEQLQACLNSFRLLQPPAPPQASTSHPLSLPLAVMTLGACVLLGLLATRGMALMPRLFLAAWCLWLGIRLLRTITAPIWTSSYSINTRAAYFGGLLVPALCFWLLWLLSKKPQGKTHVWLLILCAIAFWKCFIGSMVVFMLPSGGGYTFTGAISKWWQHSTTDTLTALDAILPPFLLITAAFWPAFCHSKQKMREQAEVSA